MKFIVALCLLFALVSEGGKGVAEIFSRIEHKKEEKGKLRFYFKAFIFNLKG